MFGRNLRFRIRPRLLTALVICMPQQSCFRIVEVLVIDQHLFDGFRICVLAVAKHLSVTNEEWHAHKNSVGPELPLSALSVGMPKAAVLGSRVRVERAPDLVGATLVLRLLCLLVEDQAKISREH